MTQEQDAWATEELIPLNKGEVEVVDSYFEQGKFATQLILVYQVHVPIDPVDYPAATTMGWYSCGKDWQILDNGARIVKLGADPTRPTKIHSSSNYGRLMNRVVKELGFDMRIRGLPTEASVWKGLRFLVARETTVFDGIPSDTSQPGSQSKEGSILLPQSIVPVGTIASTPVATSAPVTGAVVTGAVNVTPVNVTPTVTVTPTPAPTIAIPIDGTIEAYLLSLIVGKGSIQEAKTAAVRDIQIASNNEIQARILEGQLIEQWMANGLIGIVDGRITRLV